MQPAAGFDNSTLAWVRDEIDLALERAAAALARHAAAPDEGGPLAEARGHLRQAGGALTLAGLAGAARLAASVETHLETLGARRGAASIAIAAAAGSALGALRHYLGELMAGQPDQALRLFPALRALALAAGTAVPSPLQLFIPDLDRQPPRRAAPGAVLTPARAQALRLGFARGLAKWRAGEPRGLTEMRHAVGHVEQSHGQSASRALWWVARAWLDTLADPVAANAAWLDGLDRQFAALAADRPEAAQAPPELMTGLLYDIAVAPPGGELLESVRAAYRLADLLPAAGAAVEVRRESCRAPLVTAMAEWEAVGQGSTTALLRFHDVVLLFAAAARDSQDADLARLAQALADFAAWLRQQPERADAALALDVAGALVLCEDAIEQEGGRGAAEADRFAAAVDDELARLAALRAAAPLPPPDRGRWRAQQIVAQVAQEIRANLAAVAAPLAAHCKVGAALAPEVPARLHQITGALRLLDADAAARVAATVEARLAAGPETAERDAIAARLAALDQFAAALARGEPGEDRLAAFADGEAPPPAVPPAPSFAAAVPAVAEGDEMLAIFVAEAHEVLAALTAAQPALAALPTERAALQTIRRGFHTLKGSGRMVGLAALADAADALERLLNRWLAAHRPATAELQALIEDAQHLFVAWVAALERGAAPPAGGALIARCAALAGAATPAVAVPGDALDPQLAAVFVEEADEQLRQLDAALRAWRATPADVALGERMARLLHTFKGGARMCGALALGEFAHGLEARIDQALADGTAAPPVLDGFAASLGHAGQLLAELRQVCAAAPGAAADAADAAAPAAVAAPALLRVRAELVDQMVNAAGEMAIARSRIEDSVKSGKAALLDLADSVARLRGQLREFEIAAETGMQSRRGDAGAQGDFDPLELDRFTRLQELTRMMAESVNDVATVQHALQRQAESAGAALAAQSRQNRELSHALLHARMVPFGTVLERLQRVVRQTAGELGKQAGLDVQGGETPIDRNVLERMLGPLEHLLRNAVAHGVETPAQRRAAGKPEPGRVSLRIAAGDHDIRLSVADDGAGLDLAAIRRHAAAQGLLADAATAAPALLAELVFRAGFSTVAAVSEIAGRGRGLDVVRDTVTQLGGSVGVAANTPVGTRFDIVLPLTLAVIPVLLVEAAGRSWAIPAALVEEAQELDAAALAALRAAGGVTRGGRHYPWQTLAGLYGLPQAAPRAGWQLLLKGAAPLVLEVDTIKQNQEVVVKPLGAMLARVPGLAGATVLPDGTVALIVNPSAACRPVPAAPPPSATVLPAPTFAGAPAVMVVDDSLTVRKVTGRLLERAGYRVMLAKDGVDALEQLAQELPAVLLADIEMPRMDGFALLRALRAEPRLAGLPVIMITSRSAARHRQVALELGVRHYLGKPYDETALLALIETLRQEAAPGVHDV